MTPFEKAGYSKDTKFKVLRDRWGLKKGDIVTLCEDDGSYRPRFRSEDGRCEWLYLPNTAIDEGVEEELEVYNTSVSPQPKEELLLPIYNSLEDMEDKDLINFLKINHKLVGQILEKLNNGKT